MSGLSDGAAARRLGFVSAALFAPMGLHMPFFPVWLAAKGLTSAEIGLVLALPPLIRVWSAPMLCRIADKRHDPAGMLGLCSIGIAVFLFATGLFGQSIWAIAAMVMFTAFAWAPVIALSDGLTLEILSSRKRLEYGRIRLWGSVAFMAATLLGGWFLSVAGGLNLIWLIGGLAAVCALIVLSVVSWARSEAREPTSAPEAGKAQLISLPGVVCLILGVVLIQGSHAFLYGFGSLTWRQDGFSGDFIGALWAIGVLAEIALFALVGRFASSPRRGFILIIVGGFAAILRWVLLSLGLPGWALLPVQMLHALSFAGTHVGAMLLLDRVRGAVGGRATLQGWYGGASAAETALMSWISGLLFARYGGAGFLAMTVMVGVGLVFIGFAAWLWAKGENSPESAC